MMISGISNRNATEYLIAFLGLIILTSGTMLNSIFSLKSVALGSFIGQILAFFFLAYTTKMNIKFRIRSIIFSSISVTGLIITLSMNSGFSQILILLFMITLMIINARLLATQLLKHRNRFLFILRKIQFLLFFLISLRIIFDSSDVFLIGEESYFALLFGPISLALYWFDQRHGIKNLLLFLSLGFLLPNATILLFAVIQVVCMLIFSKQKSNILNITFFVFIMSIFLQFTDLTYLTKRMTTNPNESNLSSLLFLVNWNNVFTRLGDNKIIGDGISKGSAKITEVDDYSRILLDKYGTQYELTFNSGTFWLASSVQSIGFVALIVPLIILLKITTVVTSRQKISLQSASALQFILLFSLVPELFFRSNGLVGNMLFFFFLALNIRERSA